MNGIKSDPDVKMDPDALTPTGGGYMDDDLYEDTGELQLPRSGQDKDIWLTRIPKWLYQHLSDWDNLQALANGPDDELVTIGDILLFPDQQREGRASKTQPMRIFLSPQWHAKTQLPRAFQLQVNTPQMTLSEEEEKNEAKRQAQAQIVQAHSDLLANTYVFTEKDMPGYKGNPMGHNRAAPAAMKGIQDPKARVQKGRFKPRIPKQTALIGAATREYIATPLPTAEFEAFSQNRTRLAIHGANSYTNIVDMVGDHTSNTNVQKLFKTFIKSTAAAKPQINKAARIPKNELIDLLHTCFDQYAYWPMKALKAKTRQPEAYLKETLDDIADLVRAGPFASNYMRRAMYNKDSVNQVQGLAPAEEFDDGEDEEMEDVM